MGGGMCTWGRVSHFPRCPRVRGGVASAEEGVANSGADGGGAWSKREVGVSPAAEGGVASAGRAAGGRQRPGCPCPPPPQLFYSFFKSLVGKDVVVELKNDLSICGTLHSVDQYLNIKLTDISVTDPEKYPHMLSVKNCFIRGSVVRYVQLPADEVDTQLLQDAARKEALQQKQ
ncbi:U6 snRNA-associated Sm-like protein LSm2 [Neopsephotus bourkii]|uniref:U6 snRNA-associated Sm-like protein LSm2 n=1 Tax=Neopsephotus bourkii TaxID=309878 RepID=UPI002AA59318|nr:U6 snRNA-associated Sm-like protein LSm2 [Neopsephotus bourkii]